MVGRGAQRPRLALARGPDADFVQVPEQVGGILVHPVGAGPLELILSVATGQDANAERSGAAGCEEIPDAVSDDD